MRSIQCTASGNSSSIDQLEELLNHLISDEPVKERLDFPAGTLQPDGRLDLCKQSIGAEGALAVSRALASNSHVRHLLVGACAVRSSGAAYIAAAVNGREQLETLYMGCNHIEADGIEKLCDALRRNSTVINVWLKRNPIGDQGLSMLADLIAGGRNLNVLDLVHTGMTEAGLDNLVDAILSSKQDNRDFPVSYLYLGGNNLSALAAECLARLLDHNCIRGLYLSVNDLGDVGAEILSRSLRTNYSLAALSLSSNGITANGVSCICEALKHQNNLRVLELGDAPSTEILGGRPNRLGDEGAIQIADLLEANCSIEQLAISNNDITNSGARAIVKSARRNESLVELSFGKNISRHLKKELNEILFNNRTRKGKRKFLNSATRHVKSVYRLDGHRAGAQTESKKVQSDARAHQINDP